MFTLIILFTKYVDLDHLIHYLLREERIPAGSTSHTITGLLPNSFYKVRLRYAEDLPGRYYNDYGQWQSFKTSA